MVTRKRKQSAKSTPSDHGEPGRPTTDPRGRALPARRFDEVNERTRSAAASHADEPSRVREAAPPREDRAG
jgi:hypothetical protein